MKVVLTQPNYTWLGRRSWGMPPYSLALLNACLKQAGHDSRLFDPNYTDMTKDEVFDFFREAQPEVIGIGSVSTEYIRVSRIMSAIIKRACPKSMVIQGGIIPTIVPDIAMKDSNVDYWIAGEAECRLPQFLSESVNTRLLSSHAGVIYDLDAAPFPDYGDLNLVDYGTRVNKYANGLLPRNFPFAVTVTSRGCPYRCIFCAASTTSGRKMRFRSADNLLDEMDVMYQAGIREVMFFDDHFLANRGRAVKIMGGLIERKYDLTWKCMNLAIWSLDKELLEMMRNSGCYQMTMSLESGSQRVLDEVIKKPVKLSKACEILDMAKALDFETVVNFVIGFPGETWEEIRETFRLAESIGVDLVNFHIATPLPKTELMKLSLREGYLSEDFDIEEASVFGCTRGVISTSEFTPPELESLRAFEWDRINFSSLERCKTIARMEGLSMQELERWRVDTRRKCGISVVS